MKKNITDKQLLANRKNAFKWWVKTEEWKEKIKYNAIKHWLTSNIYDEELERKIIKEYKIWWTLEKMLVKNTCIVKSRYEKWIELENKLLQHILRPSKYEKVYKSKEEYENYIKNKQISLGIYDMDILSPTEPEYNLIKIDWDNFDYDTEKIEYLINVVWKYNYQNEVRFNKNILDLINLVK